MSRTCSRIPLCGEDSGLRRVRLSLSQPAAPGVLSRASALCCVPKASPSRSRPPPHLGSVFRRSYAPIKHVPSELHVSLCFLEDSTGLPRGGAPPSHLPHLHTSHNDRVGSGGHVLGGARETPGQKAGDMPSSGGPMSSLYACARRRA